MKVSELIVGQRNINIEGTISEMGEIRTFNKYGRELKVANAVFKDDSGSIKLTLWNNDTNFKEGDKIKVLNGYIGEFQGEKQLTSGKFGKIEKVGESEETDGDKNQEAEYDKFEKSNNEDNTTENENQNDKTEESEEELF